MTANGRGIFRRMTAMAMAAAVAGCGGFGLFGGGAPSAPARMGEVLGYTVADEPYTAAVGRQTLEAGGSAGDAAVAMALTLSVTYPVAASLGGGGICLGYEAKAERASSVDFLPRAPFDAGPVAVPGLLKGLDVVHREWGRLPWTSLAEPARALAANGHRISAPLAAAIARQQDKIARSPHLRVLTSRREPGIAPGTPLRTGDVLIQTQLGGVLERVRDDGAKAFYRKLIANRLLEDMRVAGGTVSQGDLAEYRIYVSSARPVKGERYTVYLPPDRLGSGVFLESLWDEAGRLDARGHATPQAFARAVHGLNAELLERYGVSGAAATDYGSTGFIAADRQGNVVACGLTMGAPFGTGGMGPLDGVVYAEAPAPGRSGLAGAFLSPVIAAEEKGGALRFAGIATGNAHAPAVVTTMALSVLRGGVPYADVLEATGSDAGSPGHGFFCFPRVRGDRSGCTAFADPRGSGRTETAVKR